MKVYTQAPLPFIGQKRNFLKHFKRVLIENISNNGDGWTIVDAFGGSGLLAHTAKRTLHKARVIYNDFDGYAERLHNIHDTNRLRQILFNILQNEPRSLLLNKNARAAVISAINSFNGYIDIDALATWILFSGKQPVNLNDIFSESFYNRIRKTDYTPAVGYLDGLEIVSESYRTLLPRFVNQEKTLLLLDPPYVCTKQGAYRKAGYFGMVEFLRLMQFVRPPFIFFSSTRSELLDYLSLVIDEKMNGWERFADYEIRQIRAPVNKDVQYEDNMIFKF